MLIITYYQVAYGGTVLIEPKSVGYHAAHGWTRYKQTHQCSEQKLSTYNNLVKLCSKSYNIFAKELVKIYWYTVVFRFILQINDYLSRLNNNYNFTKISCKGLTIVATRILSWLWRYTAMPYGVCFVLPMIEALIYLVDPD